MRILAFTILGMVLITMQTSLLQVLPEWLGLPDLLFLLIVFAAIYFEVFQGVLLCLVLGTFMEVFSGYFLGLYVISYLLVFGLVRSASTGLAIKDQSQQPAIAAVSYLLSGGLTYVFTSMLADESLSPWSWGEVLRQVLIITILAIPFNCLFHKVMVVCDKKHERKSFFSRNKFNEGNRYRPK
jgi:rod shape-determining protein MreD